MAIRTHNGGWGVFADWFGEVRCVFGGSGTSIWECLAFIAREG
jgi:hypothetical protein